MASEEQQTPLPAKEEVKPVLVRVGDEDASTLELGPEFDQDSAQPLFISEVAHLLKLQVEAKRQPDMSAELNPVLKKSLEHANKFGQLAKTDQAITVRAQLSAVVPELHPFEIAQLASLMPKEVDEAKAIIPSLVDRYDDDVLADILKIFNVWV